MSDLLDIVETAAPTLGYVLLPELRGVALLRSICAPPVEEDGYVYIALGPIAQAELARMADLLDIVEDM